MESLISNIENIIKSKDSDAIYLAAAVLLEQNTKEADELLSKLDYTLIIRNYSDICKYLRIEELTISDFSIFPIEQRSKMLAFHQIKNIEKLFNNGWVPDWPSSKEYRYVPYFNYNKSSGGWVFVDSDCHSGGSDGAVGFYKNEKVSNFVGKTFLAIYKELLE